ncbi:hypothetical protein L1987_09015 [Smallanthus sonchifolius]|uniref:Uncharacterized protein n=1 Tax=Smallanthus sonchifolius TaxID=185202 RepID=A0ACB9JMT1_9ASTR|nr:hypothetical protein L1987_09015 [Smallanthus sonchifolius]
MPRGPRIDVSYWEWLCQVVEMWRVEEDLPATLKQGIDIDLLERDVKSIRRDLVTLPTLVENVNGIAEDQRLIDQSLQHASSHIMEFEKRLEEM